MPLSGKARVEVYVPDLPSPLYGALLQALEREFAFTFGGCTTIRGLDGSYLLRSGTIAQDWVNVIYTDAPFPVEENIETLSRYADELKLAAFEALEEEAVLVTIAEVYHAE